MTASPPENLGHRLASEIARVAVLRERYASLAGLPGVNVRPALAFMDAALGAAKRAAGTDDAIEYLRCVKVLEGFTE